MPGARCTRSLACENVWSTRASHHRFTGSCRHSLRNGFNGFLRALPGDRAFLPPSPARNIPRDLTPASGRQDHTTSPSATSAFVFGAARVHRIPSRVRDDRETPLRGNGTKSQYSCFYRDVKRNSENQKLARVPRCEMAATA